MFFYIEKVFDLIWFGHIFLFEKNIPRFFFFLMSLFLGSKSCLNRMESSYSVPEDNELLAQKQYPKVWFCLDRIHPVSWLKPTCSDSAFDSAHDTAHDSVRQRRRAGGRCRFASYTVEASSQRTTPSRVDK